MQVGNSGSLLLRNFGRSIDSHDIVVRLNQVESCTQRSGLVKTVSLIFGVSLPCRRVSLCAQKAVQWVWVTARSVHIYAINWRPERFHQPLNQTCLCLCARLPAEFLSANFWSLTIYESDHGFFSNGALMALGFIVKRILSVLFIIVNCITRKPLYCTNQTIAVYRVCWVCYIGIWSLPNGQGAMLYESRVEFYRCTR